MKKVIVLVVYFVLFNSSLNAQNNCFTLESTEITELETAKNENNYNALQKLGLHYFQVSEKIVDKEQKRLNRLTALNYFEKAHSIGQNESNLRKTSYYYSLANYRNKDYDLAFKYMDESARKKYFLAQFYVAEFYEKGIGTEVNIEKAVEHYIPIASRFNPFQAIACDRLGRLYYHKLSDSDKAAQWLIKAVNLGYTKATYLLLNINDKYIKDISLYDDKTQRIKGYKFNKDGKLYENDCNSEIFNSESKYTSLKTRHKLNPKMVSEKKDPLALYRMGYYKKRGQINDAKRSMLESLGGKQINFSSGKAPLIFPNITQDHPFLEQAYNFIKDINLDNIYQIQKEVKTEYSFYRVYINEYEKTFYVFVIERKSLRDGYFSHKLIQLGKVGLHEFELYNAQDQSFKRYNYPLPNIPWYFKGNNIKNHTHYNKG